MHEVDLSIYFFRHGSTVDESSPSTLVDKRVFRDTIGQRPGGPALALHSNSIRVCLCVCAQLVIGTWSVSEVRARTFGIVTVSRWLTFRD